MKNKSRRQPSLRYLIIFLFITLAVIPGLIFVTLSWYQYDRLLQRDAERLINNTVVTSVEDRQVIIDDILGSLRNSGFIFFGFYILLTVPLLLYFSSKLTSPLRQLEAKAKQMATGALAGEVDFSKNQSWAFRELGPLVEAFEALRQRVINSYQELESQVAERTWDLHSKINQLTRAESKIGNVNKQLNELLALVERQKVLLQDVLDHIPVGVIITKRPNGFFEFSNKRASFLLGEPRPGVSTYTQRYDIYKNDKTTPYPAGELPINSAFKTKKASYVEDLVLRKPGDEFISLYAQTAVLYDKTGEVELSIMIFDDITARKEIERQKSEFVSVVSHQLRTPLSAVRWFVELLSESGQKLFTKEQKEYLANIYESNIRLINLVNDLLNVSRIEAGKVKPEAVITDVELLIKGVVRELTPLITERKQKINILTANQIPKIYIDPKLISQVVMNLLSNAVKYSPDGAEVKVNLRHLDKDLEISVIDQGLGIPEKDQHKVFTKFFRADNVVKKETEGTGLGLYVVKQIINNSGGKIWFASGENKGTTFTFTLPMAGDHAPNSQKSLI